MPEQTFIAWLVGQTGLAGLAAFSIWMMAHREKEHEAEFKVLLTSIQATLEKNTLAMLELAKRPPGGCPLDAEGILSVMKRLAKAHETG